MKGLGRLHRKPFTNPGNLFHILLPFRMLFCFPVQLIVIAHQEFAYPIHNKDNAFIKRTLFFCTRCQVMLCFFL